MQIYLSLSPRGVPLDAAFSPQALKTSPGKEPPTYVVLFTLDDLTESLAQHLPQADQLDPIDSAVRALHEYQRTQNPQWLTKALSLILIHSEKPLERLQEFLISQE